MPPDDIAALRREYADHGLAEGDLAADPVTMFAGGSTRSARRGCTSRTRWWSPPCRSRTASRRRGWCCSRASPTRGSCSSPTCARARGRSSRPSRAARCCSPGTRSSGRSAWRGRRGAAAADVSAYFATRPRGSRLGAHASHQSQVVASRAELDAAYAEAEAGLPRRGARARGVGRLPRPARGRGVLAGPARPDARPACLPRDGDGWRTERLAP